MKVAMLSTLTRMDLLTPEGTRISELVVAFTRGQKFGPKKQKRSLLKPTIDLNSNIVFSKCNCFNESM
jgi:hypothetical protein